MSLRDQKRWEISQLNESINFDTESITIDPSPFQLVEKTPISKAQRLFTMLSVRRAYVTQLGSLVGVVGLKELRSAIEDINNGNLTECTGTDSHSETENDDRMSSEHSVYNDVERPH